MSLRNRKKSRRKPEENKEYLLPEESSFLMQEDYNALRTNIQFSFPDEDPKVIAVTSANLGEGKSTNAINLAYSFSQIGKRVILIDCDLRLPTLASKLKIHTWDEDMQGLTNFLVKKGEFQEVVIHYKERFDVLCSGTLPPDPTRLLQSRRMAALLEALKERYDYVILDCPPVNVVVDAVLLAPCVDGYLLVVRHGTTETKDVAEALSQLQFAEAKLLGLLYVDVPVDGLRKYYR